MADNSLYTHTQAYTHSLSRAHTQEILSEAVNRYVADNSRLPRTPLDLSQYYVPSRSDEQAADSIVQRHHQQLLPPGLQQRFHHVQVPIVFLPKTPLWTLSHLYQKSYVMAQVPPAAM